MIKEVIDKNINNHYDVAAEIIGISEVILVEFLNR